MRASNIILAVKLRSRIKRRREFDIVRKGEAQAYVISKTYLQGATRQLEAGLYDCGASESQMQPRLGAAPRMIVQIEGRSMMPRPPAPLAQRLGVPFSGRGGGTHAKALDGESGW